MKHTLTMVVGCVVALLLIFFNRLVHGFDVGPILKSSVAIPEVALGLVTTFILAWFAGVLIAGIYNLSLRLGK